MASWFLKDKDKAYSNFQLQYYNQHSGAVMAQQVRLHVTDE